MTNLIKKPTFLLLLLLSIYCCKSERKKIIKDSEVNLELTTYYNQKLNFSIEYPKDWVLLNSNDEVVFAVKEEDASVLFGSAVHITLLMDTINNSINLEKVMEESNTSMSNSFNNFGIEKIEELQINNNPAIKVKCSFEASSNNVKSLLYFVKTSRRIYLVALSGNIQEFDKYEKIYEYIAKTFKAE
jgi:hypothetical protein